MPLAQDCICKQTIIKFSVSPLDVTLEVREGDNKPPSFRDGPGSEIELQEGYTRFAEPVAKYTAQSNIPGDDTLFFHLVSGRTEKTNKGTNISKNNTFFINVRMRNYYFKNTCF